MLWLCRIGSVVLALAALGIGAPVQASFNDQFVCETADRETLFVSIMSRDSTQATVQRGYDGPDMEQTALLSPTARQGRLFDYSGDGYRFVGADDLGLLIDPSGVWVCRFPGSWDEEPDDNGTALLPRISLDSRGLSIHRPGVPINIRANFGESKSRLNALLSRFLGAPGPELRGGDCPNGEETVRRFGPLFVTFTGNRWTGWLLADDPRTREDAVPVTFRGFEPGAAAKAIADLVPTHGTSEPEHALRLSGATILLDAAPDAPAAEIRQIQAGSACGVR